MIKNSEKMTKTCCFACISVGRRTLIIGILNIICAILSVVLNSMEISHWTKIKYPDPIKEPNFRQTINSYITFSCIQIFIAVVYLILSCLIVDGYRMRKHRFITPWLVWNYVALCLVAAATAYLFLLLAAGGEVGAGFIVLAVSSLILSVQSYFVYVVKTFVDGLKGSSIC
ncbi:uncharacterized protein LOC110850349 [Folsomia candida]|uniref:uncharacterized protein LOC110850349 n=1 Tax=Folsomia candida TaxID=158441 RepID=UPI000B8F86DD|nr:uncharacterized protein LOC110850349 [Folsomia candida]